MALNRNIIKLGLIISVLAFAISGLPVAAARADGEGTLRLGWASADITPEGSVLISGQLHARVSEGVRDPITATALALESVRGDQPVRFVMVSCDLITISEDILATVRKHLRRDLPDLDPTSVMLFATHTHSAPLTSLRRRYRPEAEADDLPYGIELDVVAPADYVGFAGERIARAVKEAWNSRAPGAVAFGLGHAVVGRNRLVAYRDGRSRMYGAVNNRNFSHIEGYEDHALHVLTTYDAEGELTGMILNLACPSQVSEREYRVSADFWHETRQELRRRFGDELFVLAQHGPAGDQSPRILVDRRAEERMFRLAGINQRQAIAVRIADAVEAIRPLIEKEIETDPVLTHRVETLELPRRRLSERDAERAASAADGYRQTYERLKRELEEDDAERTGRWYHDISRAYRRKRWNRGVVERHAIQEEHPHIEVEIHVARLGGVAFASSPFELYLDFGVQIRGRSRAVQTFLVQLAGPGSYLPTERSVRGGAYGAVPASTEVGPESGRILVDWTVDAINGMW